MAAKDQTGTIKDPPTYYKWVQLLASESRALDFEDKWEKSLRAVATPPRMGDEKSFQDDRWFDALAAHPNPRNDVWLKVRDWKEFQKYIQASVAIFKSPLYSGRVGPAPTASVRHEAWYRCGAAPSYTPSQIEDLKRRLRDDPEFTLPEDLFALGFVLGFDPRLLSGLKSLSLELNMLSRDLYEVLAPFNDDPGARHAPYQDQLKNVGHFVARIYDGLEIMTGIVDTIKSKMASDEVGSLDTLLYAFTRFSDRLVRTVRGYAENEAIESWVDYMLVSAEGLTRACNEALEAYRKYRDSDAP